MKTLSLLLLSLVPAAAMAQITDELIPQLPPAASPEEDPFADINNAPQTQTPARQMLPDERALRREPIPPRESLTASAPVAAPTVDNTPPAPAAATLTTASDPAPAKATTTAEAPRPAADELVSPAVQAVEARLPRISNEDLAALNPVIPEAPSWLVTQQRLDVQFYVHKRALERESELTKIRADIAENEKRVRKALSDEEENSGGRNSRPALSFGPATGNIDPDNFEQLASLAGYVRAAPAAASAPPPPPPPRLIAITGQQATLEINGMRQTLSVGERSGDYQLSRIGFSDVALSNRGSVITLNLEW